MTMPVVQVRIMWVLVPQRLVAVGVGMGLQHVSFVPVLMVFVMHMGVFMLKFGMEMLMLMALRQMQPRP